MKKLNLDWGDMELAFGNSSYEIDYYLDTETGQVQMVTEEAQTILKSIYEEYAGAGEDATFDLLATLPQTRLPDWQKHMVLEAHQIETAASYRYLPIPKSNSREAYEIMQDYIVTVENARLEDRLWQAIQGRRPFRRFKDVLIEYPDELDQWYVYKSARSKEEIREWLEKQHIEPANDDKD